MLLLILLFITSYFVNAQFITRNIVPLMESPTPKITYRKDIDRRKYIRQLLGTENSNKFQNQSVEYPGYDGWYNNIGKPELGAIDTPLLRRWPAAYEDGVYKLSGSKRPQPLVLSESLLKGDIGTKSRTGKNALMVFFGQHVVEEILDAQRPACPPEYINIQIPEEHRYRKKTGHTQMPVLRTRYDERTGHSPNNPRQQLNEITPFLDGGLIYGTTKAWSNYLRMYSNGKLDQNGLLAFSHGGKFPEYNTIRLPMANPPPPARHGLYTNRHYTEEVERFFKLGNPRGNENPFLLTFGIVWFRWHNVVAKELKKQNPNWSGEKIYNEARKWVIASQQQIVFYEWLPQWLGMELPKYKNYDPTVDPQIDQFFQSAAFRFGHTLVPAGVYLRNYGELGCQLKLGGRAIRTCNNFWMSENGLFDKFTRLEGTIDVERLLMGMAVQLAEEEDHKIVEDLRGNVFGPLEFSRRDLMALNIQRARDHGLPDYNTARKAYNLQKVTSVDHFKKVSLEIKYKFLELYKSFDDVDIWVGGILETEDGPGELFKTIIADQFERIRNGDRFWFENENNGLFTTEDIIRIKNLNFYQILLSVTDVGEKDLPANVFKVPVSEDDINTNCTREQIVKKGECSDFSGNSIPCFHADPVTSSKVDDCSDPGTYDYFSNSEISFVLTFGVIISIFGCFWGFLYWKLHETQRKFLNKHVDLTKSCSDIGVTGNMYTASEWIGPSVQCRPVIITLHKSTRQIQVKNQLGHMSRVVDLHVKKIMMFVGHHSQYVLIRVDHNYDLVLKFDSIFLRSFFVKSLDNFLMELNIEREIVSRITAKAVLKQAITKSGRQKKVEQFFRVVFSQAFNIAHSEDELLQIDSKVAKEVIYTELTIIEFAEALSMRPDSEFVKKIFNLVDMDKNGFISFREFIDMLVLFLKGTAEEKLKLMFDMYDINRTGQLKREDFANMLRSFMETVNADISNDELESIVHSMMDQAQIANKETIDLEDFKNILGEFNDKFSYAELEFNVNSNGTSKKLHAGKSTIRSTFIGEVKQTMESLYADPNDLKSRVEGKTYFSSNNDAANNIDNNEKIIQPKVVYTEWDQYWNPITKFVANKQLQIFWVFLYTMILLGIFSERVYYYSTLREHRGLRRITGYGVSITRGAASAMMFTYSSMLLTMCQNTITILRDTALQFYIPFDYAFEMHKYIACWALFFTAIHIVGHGFNFYHIATQTSDDLTCLFRNNFHATHEIPKFHYWVWSTMTGVTSIVLTIITGIIFVCSIPMIRQKLYKYFALGHTLYPLFYILMFLHGSGRLIQEPFFHYFFLCPVFIFTIDKIFSATRKTVEIPLLKVTLLPSNVTCLIFQKPQHFQYKSGQWIRISCPALSANEYHPFTLSSAPHESTLSVHIRSVGPWTHNIRNKLDPNNKKFKILPKIHVDGPYGESHQNWDKYDISIMVAGGIGVTPFASILKDIVFKSNQKLNLGCKKVYFIWVTQSQKQFEWMIDILRDVEKDDVNNFISAHLFVTQFYQKFDLRTILLYICERHFQKISNKSLFTGLTAVTHFGRPNFAQFFLAIQKIHNDVNKIGVFSCGTPTLTRAVDSSCQNLNNRDDTYTIFQHYYKSY
ncbi:GSCOCT00006031001.3-RA-CDS [Cotesia congregata]|uniref:NAD(P)H oxidase (H2O2-forming) n=1 Tax=Cotesia congregata TaxID=51543 RepID=A0A8J2HJZ5_COTCN|nr:GSCOCT00006031001.3-RA-CDS [Cotesia congregata]CAG5100375.1 Dual oxidase [Cotesia congregata]